MSETEQKPLNSEIPTRIGNELVVRDANGRVVSGVLNPNGRPQGSLDFKTKWLNFIDKVAKQNNITPNEVDEQLLAVAFKQAKEANYPFWRDIQDRVHGKPLEKGEYEIKLPKPIDELPEDLRLRQNKSSPEEN